MIRLGGGFHAEPDRPAARPLVTDGNPPWTVTKWGRHFGLKDMTIKGSCHSGKVAFEIEGVIPDKLTRCTCSFCAKRGALPHR
jgi:hypothetical protein